MTAFGAEPTACPSGRIPWELIIERAEEEDMANLKPAIDLLIESAHKQQAQIDGLMALMTAIHGGEADATLTEVRVLAAENERRLDAAAAALR